MRLEPHPGVKVAGRRQPRSSTQDRLSASKRIGQRIRSWRLHRRSEHARSWYAIVDGNNTQIDAIRACATKYQVQVPILIDFIHVIQYLWKAAGTFFYPGDPAGRDWVKTQAEKILQGNAGDVATGIRRRATRFGYTGKEREGADTCATVRTRKSCDGVSASTPGPRGVAGLSLGLRHAVWSA